MQLKMDVFFEFLISPLICGVEKQNLYSVVATMHPHTKDALKS